MKGGGGDCVRRKIEEISSPAGSVILFKLKPIGQAIRPRHKAY